jgi:hypothetical protein
LFFLPNEVTVRRSILVVIIIMMIVARSGTARCHCQPPTDAVLQLSHWRHCRFQCACGNIAGQMSLFATIKLPKNTVRFGEKVRCASLRKVPA